MSLGSLHEVVLGPQGIIVTYLDDDVPEGVDAQRSFRICLLYTSPSPRD